MAGVFGIIIIIGFIYGCYKFIQMLRSKDIFTKMHDDAEASAKKIIDDANNNAESITKEANRKAYLKLAEASSTAEQKITDAETQANRKLSEVNREYIKKYSELTALKEEANQLEKEVLISVTEILDDESLAGITSEECKDKLMMLKLKEKDLISSGNALRVTAHNDKKVVNNNIKQILRCFSTECDNHLCNLSVKNVGSAKMHIQRSYETLNKIFETDGVRLTDQILRIKLDEATLVFGYEQKKEQEREQQKAIKEQMIEEEKVRREIERAKAQIDKDEKHLNGEISKLMAYMNKSTDSVQNQLYVDKIKELEAKLNSLESDKKNVLDREQNARAGFVYIISNIGSFGENIYKIGMTRRLEPMDRIKELSSASVPFEFDVHAMIFSDDAPKLETVLHQTFDEYKVNKVNDRKEFYKVPLKDIEDVVKKNHNATVEFTLLAQAKEYRESLRIIQSKEFTGKVIKTSTVLNPEDDEEEDFGNN